MSESNDTPVSIVIDLPQSTSPFMEQRKIHTTEIPSRRKAIVISPPRNFMNVEPRKAHFRNDNSLTLKERWSEFTYTPTYKLCSKVLDPKKMILLIVSCLVIGTLVGYVTPHDLAYTSDSQCSVPLVIFQHSTLLTEMKTEEIVDIKECEDLKKISECYLEKYSKNMSCITPISYGFNKKMISIRSQDGSITHLVNPKNPHISKDQVEISEGNMLFPDIEPVTFYDLTSILHSPSISLSLSI